MTESPTLVPDGLLLGAHMPTTGGIRNALTEGVAIGCSTVQLFTSSPQQWKARPLADEQVALFKEAHQQTGVHPLVVHDSYLINLATADEEVRSKSIRAFLDEMDRCEALGIHYLVTHCGASGKETADRGLALLSQSLSEIHRAAAGYKTRITLEVTAGQGTCLGHKFEHLGTVLLTCAEAERLSVCLDTCHVFAAGYDLRTQDVYEATIEEFDRRIGLDRLTVIHMNDARKDLGSRVDRHEHIGKGFIGPEAFRLLLRDERFRHIPKIVETPDFKLHEANIRVLRRLAAIAEPVHLEDGKIVIRGGDPDDPDTSFAVDTGSVVAGAASAEMEDGE